MSAGPSAPHDVARRAVDQDGDSDPRAEHHASDSQRPGQRQHRSGGESLADGAAAGEDAADAHQHGAGEVTPHFAIVIERFPSQFGRTPSGQTRSGNDAEHAADAEIGEIRDVEEAGENRLADRRDEGQALRARRPGEFVDE